MPVTYTDFEESLLHVWNSPVESVYSNITPPPTPPPPLTHTHTYTPPPHKKTNITTTKNTKHKKNKSKQNTKRFLAQLRDTLLSSLIVMVTTSLILDAHSLNFALCMFDICRTHKQWEYVTHMTIYYVMWIFFVQDIRNEVEARMESKLNVIRARHFAPLKCRVHSRLLPSKITHLSVLHAIDIVLHDNPHLLIYAQLT